MFSPAYHQLSTDLTAPGMAMAQRHQRRGARCVEGTALAPQTQGIGQAIRRDGRGRAAVVEGRQVGRVAPRFTGAIAQVPWRSNEKCGVKPTYLPACIPQKLKDNCTIGRVHWESWCRGMGQSLIRTTHWHRSPFNTAICGISTSIYLKKKQFIHIFKSSSR